MVNDERMKGQAITVVIDPEYAEMETARHVKEKFDTGVPSDLTLRFDANGLALISEGQVLRGDFTRMLPRLKQNNLSQELLVRTAKIKDPGGPLLAVDATAGMGEDSLLLAAAGFHVQLYERNPVIFELLSDALRRAAEIPELKDIVERMHAHNEDSMEAMKNLDIQPDVILLDPMFPERQKSSLVKKKLQVIQKLEMPCADEKELVLTAIQTKPKKLIVKRPPKGPYLAGLKPDFSNGGKAVRFDCIVSPFDRIGKFKFE